MKETRLRLRESSECGITDEDGAFAIEGIPAGEYEVHVQRPDGQLNAGGRVKIRANELSRTEAVFFRKQLRSREVLRLAGADASE